MKRKLSGLAPWAAVATFLGGVSWLILSSKPFQHCVQEAGGSSSAKQPEEYVAALSSSLAVYRDCLGEFTHANAEPIIAAFTVVLSIATIALWFATRRLVTGAEETAKRQLRAYVYEREMEIERLGLGVKTAVKFKIINSGQTPAYDVKHWSEIRCLPADNTEFPSLEFTPHRRVTNPDSFFFAISTADEPLTKDDILGIQDGTKRLYIWGRIEYRDAFEEARWVTYRCQVEHLSASQSVLASSPDGNNAN